MTWELPIAEDDSDRKLLADIASHGWHIVGVDRNDSGPDYVFSVGMGYTLSHPEVLIMGLPHAVGASLINSIGDAVRAGATFESGKQYDDLAEGFPLKFVSMHVDHYADYLGYALWFYRHPAFPVLQCVWPDKSGVFPGESNYDSRFFDLQRILSK